jgi:hypothetical protein
VLHLYIEPRHTNGVAERDIAASFSRELQKLDKQYHHNPYNIYDSDTRAEAEASAKLVEVTILPQGTFAGYIAQRQAEGADLGHLKPPHISPTDSVLGALVPQSSPRRSAAVTPPR